MKTFYRDRNQSNLRNEFIFEYMLILIKMRGCDGSAVKDTELVSCKADSPGSKPECCIMGWAAVTYPSSYPPSMQMQVD